jgi:DNA polymerase-3 subunit delta
MKPDEFDKSIKKGGIGPLYFFYGEETYLLERGVKRLIDRVLAPESRDFNLNVFYGNECKGYEIVESAQTFPMFADRRVVLVKKGSELSAAAMEVLTGYLQDPAPTTCLIFQGEKIDQRKKFFLELKKKGELVEYKRTYENQLALFIREEAAGRSKKLEPAAAELLVYLVGNNLRELAAQVEKVAIYAGDRDTITIGDIRATVADTRIDSVFELANALGEKRLANAIRALHTILRDGESPLMVLAMLTRHFRQLWKVRELLDRKLPPQEISKASGINPYFVKGVIEQARKYQVPELKKVFEGLFATDLALKSAGGKPAHLMERLVMDICGGFQKW